jgi:predicted nucleic acid-binding protein
MRIVIDSNIVFSAILNTKSRIGQLILNGSKYFDYFTVALLQQELENHKDKILKVTGYSEIQYNEIYDLIVSKIRFIDDILISDADIEKAIKLVKEIDENDTLFIALSIHLHTNLWTGDKKLINGLIKKDFSKIISTDNLYELYLEKEMKTKLRKK